MMRCTMIIQQRIRSEEHMVSQQGHSQPFHKDLSKMLMVQSITRIRIRIRIRITGLL